MRLDPTQSTRRGFASHDARVQRYDGCVDAWATIGSDPGPICVQKMQIQQTPESTPNGPGSYHVVGGLLTLEFKELMQDNQVSGKETLWLVRLGCKHMHRDVKECYRYVFLDVDCRWDCPCCSCLEQSVGCMRASIKV